MFKSHKKVNIGLFGPVIILVFILGLFPFIIAFKDSFFHDSFGNISFAGLENYKYILSDKGFPYSLNITVLWAILNVIFSLLIGFMFAIRLVNRGKRITILHRFLFIPWGIPVYIAIPLWRAFLHGNGGESVLSQISGFQLNLMTDPISGFLGTLIVSLWLTIPATTFVFEAHIKKVQKEVIEAAYLDGASEGDIALYIYLPEIKESLMAMGVLNFIKSFKEFTLVFMMTAGGPPLISGITDRHIIGSTTTLGVFLYEVFLQTNDWGINASYSIIMAILVILIIGIWLLVKRKNSSTILMFLSAVFLIPSGDITLYFFAGFYILIGLHKPFRKYFFTILIIQSVYIIFKIYNYGFLDGFYSGICISYLAYFYDNKNKKRELIYNSLSVKRYFIKPFSTVLSTVFIVLTVIVLYMLLWMSISKISLCYIDTLLPKEISFSNFSSIFMEEGILKYFKNTLLISGVSSLLLPLLVFPGAVFLDKINNKKALLLLAIIQVIGIAGGMHSLIPLYRMFRTINLINSYIPLIFIYLYHAIPFSLFILTAYLKTLPKSYHELALLEGMSNIAYSFKILLPLTLPTLAITIMMAFISAWNGFQAPLLFLNDEDLYTISIKLFSYVGSLGSGQPLWNIFAAVSVVNSIFIGVIFILLKKVTIGSNIKSGVSF